MNTKYVHIGLPKNLSTTLQRDYFDKHPEIYHLGVGIGSNIDYINPKIASACENHFQYSKNFSYRKQKDSIKSSFNQEFIKFKADHTKKACGISLELLSFTFTPDQIEIEEKAKRVFEAFGKDTKIILIVREQFSLLESLYKEAIKIGYYGGYLDYLEYIYYSRDRNFIFDFQYDYLFEIYSKYFGYNNVEVLVIENFRNKNGDLKFVNNKCKLIQKFDEILKLNNFDISLNHHNEPLSLKELHNMLELNRKNIHGLGNQSFSTATNFHRLKDYFSNELGIEVKNSILFKDARIKNNNIKLAKKNSKKISIEFEYPPNIKNFLCKLFYESNTNFEKLANVKLPSSYFK